MNALICELAENTLGYHSSVGSIIMNTIVSKCHSAATEKTVIASSHSLPSAHTFTSVIGSLNSVYKNTCHNASLFRCRFIQYIKNYYFKSNGSQKFLKKP
jgi:hypothetical protein